MIKSTTIYKKIVSNFEMGRLKDIHKGNRCFIVGNGPSLNKMDLSLLKNDYVFGLNRIYLMPKKRNLKIDYYVTVNKLLINQFASEIDNRIKVPKFISWSGEHEVDFDSNTRFIRLIDGPTFSKDIRKGLWAGGTVTYVAIQIAYYMGFEEVILIGVDHSFKDKGPANNEENMKGNDQNHFSPNYFKGYKWNLPDLETSELAYSMADYFFKKNDRVILDATVGGKLNIFNKVKYQSLLSKKK